MSIRSRTNKFNKETEIKFSEWLTNILNTNMDIYWYYKLLSLNPVITYDIIQNNPELPFYEVNCGTSPELAGHFGVQGVPNITYCEKREVRETPRNLMKN